MLLEIKGWLDANPREIVMLYYGTKPLVVSLPSQAAAMYDMMLKIFGSTIWTPADGDPLQHSRREILAKGKRVVFEDHDKGYDHPAYGKVLVFADGVWKTQFIERDLTPFPDCRIGNSSWYGNQLVRALVGTLATNDGLIEHAASCGVNIVSPNYIMPDDLAKFVWTRVPGQPCTCRCRGSGVCHTGRRGASAL